MSDLREQIVKTLQSAGWPMSAERAVSNVWPIIEAELQKEHREISRWIRDCQSLIEELTEANQLLEQTIEVLEAAPEVDNAGRECCEDCDWWLDKAKPLLDKLQALKKEGTE